MKLSPGEADALAALLGWYADAGVDWAVDEAPHDRFLESEQGDPEPEPQPQVQPRRLKAAGPAPAPTPVGDRAAAVSVRRPAVGGAPITAEAAERSARETAASAASLEDLRAALESFEGCALKRTASRLVFADGDPKVRVMLVGEAPGAEEDRTGLPFVGRAGQLLDKMLASIGLDRSKVYIANVVPWRPPGNRTPTPQETAVCLPFIRRQIALVGPDVVVALGGASAQSLFGLKEGVMRLRGSWRNLDIETDHEKRSIPTLITLHPAYLLRTPSAKRLAWRDLRELRKAIDGLPPR